MPGDAVSRTANVERNGGHKWVNNTQCHDTQANLQNTFDYRSLFRIQVDSSRSKRST